MAETKDSKAEDKAESKAEAKAETKAAEDEDIVTADTSEEQEAAAQQDRDQADARPLSGSEGGQAPPKE